MEATDLAEQLRAAVVDLDDIGADASAGYEDTDFFVDVAGERFLVAVMKVSE